MIATGFFRIAALTLSLCLVLAACANAQSTSTSPVPDPHAEHAPQKPATPAAGGSPSQHDEHHTPAANETSASPDLPSFIPAITDEDRKAAFPDVGGHAAHDSAIHSFVLVDQLEWQTADAGARLNLDGKGWIGGDRDRLWFRAEGDADEDRIGEARAHVLFGRQISRWWDVVGGIRQDFGPGPARTWAAIGVQGLAPYWFEIEATGYVGASGRTQARLEVEYELLLTNRLVLQPLVELEIAGKSDPERGIGAGVSTTDAGFRLRYEIRREVAPYVGVVWSTKWGKTADLADAAGDDTGGARFVSGLRLWF